MSSVLDLLQAAVPGIQPQAAADFRSTLVAIAKELHSASGAEHRSLQQWWQWLDEEGYDRDGLVQILRQFCRARIGEEGLAVLSESCASIQEHPDGMHLLLDWLEARHADLNQELQELDAACLAEQAELEQTAGGMSKGWKIGLSSTGGVLVLAVGLYGVYKWKKSGETPEAVAEKFNQKLTEKANQFKDELKDEWFRSKEAMDNPDSAKLVDDEIKNLGDRYKSYGEYFDVDKAAKPFMRDVKSEARSIARDLVLKRVGKVATKEELKIMSAAGIDQWDESDLYAIVDNRIPLDEKTNQLLKDPKFIRYAERKLVAQAKVDLLRQFDPIKLTNGIDDDKLRTYLNANRDLLTEKGRDLLAGKASEVEQDVTIDFTDGLKDLGRQMEKKAEYELQDGLEDLFDGVENEIGDVVDDGEQFVDDEVEGLLNSIGKTVKTDVGDVVLDAKAAERNAVDI